MRIASSSDSDTENGELGRSRSRSGSGDLEGEPSGDESCGEGVMDDLGPAMDEKALADLLKGKKRVDEKPVTLRLNKAMIDTFNLVVKLAQEEEPKELAAQVLKHRQCLVELATKYAAIANMYTDARTAANKGADLQKFLTEMSWDLLQLLGQHDLGITDMRRWVQSSTWRLIFPVTPRPDLWFQDRHRAVPDGQVQEAAEGGDERLKDEEGARRLPLHSTQGPEPDRQGGGKV